MHYDFCSKFIHYNSQYAVPSLCKCERMGLRLPYFTRYYTGGYITNIQVYSHGHPTARITLESSLQGRVCLHLRLVDQETISAKDDS